MARSRKKAAFEVPAEWTFKTSAVAAAFDSHVREQLPWYELATGIVAHFARAYLPERGTVLDVGASTGNIGRALAPTLQARHATLVAIDSSPSMAPRYDAPGRLLIASAEDFDYEKLNPDVVVCFLSLMFVPFAKRRATLFRMRRSLRPGGALIVFDKTEPRAGYLGTTMYRLTLAAKRENGASAEEVIAKELSISGVQRPLTEEDLDGFVEVFRFGDFAGFVFCQ